MKTIYNIIDFGAVAGSDEVQTEKIQAAIDAAFLAGGGEVVVPEGVFNTGTIRLRSNVTFRLLSGAVLNGSKNLDDYTHFLDDKIEPIDPDSEFDEDYDFNTQFYKEKELKETVRDKLLTDEKYTFEEYFTLLELVSNKFKNSFNSGNGKYEIIFRERTFDERFNISPPKEREVKNNEERE